MHTLGLSPKQARETQLRPSHFTACFDTRVAGFRRRMSGSQHVHRRFDARESSGSSNALRLRADTPLSSAPLESDFDAAVTHTQRWSRATRTATVDPRASRLLDHLDAATRVTSPPPSISIPPLSPAARRGPSVEGWPMARQHVAEIIRERTLRRTRPVDRIKSGSVQDSHFADPPPQQQHGGQEYEMVDVQVVEETPERTVSISTWREQVIHETEIDDGMSVCYVNAEGAYVRVREEGTRPMVDRSPSIPSSKVLQGGRRTESISEFGRQPLRHHPSTSSKPSSDPRTSTPKGSGTLIQPLDSPLFHALKHTGSIISSIPPKSAEELDDFLCSCQPSLLHISSVLHKVGIRTMDHLRAVGRLSAETRNREVREQVLRRGVTVVEWAILLDRLRGV
ncbi:unnamed protein product [Mycena citricolor]|uniref:Uncharacterized protein n=1 Tax=Mycena citricolor TaxID=2018698 RepID=A0AAD2HY16_9AGAR|nr:unnamed protein product [Mycena citricolor]